MPPAVVTTTSTILCSTRKRTCSRTPADIKLDVKPRKIFARTFCRCAGLKPASAGPGGSSLRRHAIWHTAEVSAAISNVQRLQ